MANTNLKFDGMEFERREMRDASGSLLKVIYLVVRASERGRTTDDIAPDKGGTPK